VSTDVTAAAPASSDLGLVRRALDGDADAFASLFHMHKHRVYAVILRMTNNTAEADDLTQDVFIQVFRKLSTFRGESALSTWLYRLAVNTALMHFRKQAPPQVSLDDDGDREAVSPVRREHGQHDERLRCSLDRIALARALSALPDGYRTIFELHEIQGYGHREIARLLHCSVGNSKSQLHKAKQRIRECLVPRRVRIQPFRNRRENRSEAQAKRMSAQTDSGTQPTSRALSIRAFRKSDIEKTQPALVLEPTTQCLAEAF
jgi:RNA polymerase sigma-70 factor (ECF subfamily)